MAQSLIRGSTQIMPGSITADRFAVNLNLATSQLADGSSIIMKGGSVAFTANQSMGNFRLTNLADPIDATDAANLRTVQALVNGIVIKPTCRVVSIVNQALTGLPTIDGKTLLAGERILLSAQSDSTQNGPWVVAAGSWSRPADFSAASTHKAGIMIIVAEGTTYQDTKWLCITDGDIVVDTTSTSWIQDLSGINYINGSGLSLTGNTFSLNYGNGIEDNGSGAARVKLDGATLSLSASGLKIANGAAASILMANSGGIATYTAVTGDVTISNAGVTTINSAFTKTANYVSNETPAGAVNGVNVTFTLAFTPNAAFLQLYLNGQLLEPGAGNDYTISENTITMLFTPQTNDKIRAYYLK